KDTYNNRHMGINYKKMKDLGLIIYGPVESTEMAAESKTFRLIGSVIVLVTVSLAIVAALAVAGYLSQVTNAIKDAFKQVEKGDLTAEVTGAKLFGSKGRKERKLDPHGNEIHQIALSFNEAIAQFRKTIQTLQTNSSHLFAMSAELTEIGQQTNSETEEVYETISGIYQSKSVHTQYTEQTAQRMNELAETLKKVETHMKQMNELSAETSRASLQNSDSMNQVNENWKETIAMVEALQENVQATDRNIHNVESIVEAIQEIS